MAILGLGSNKFLEKTMGEYESVSKAAFSIRFDIFVSQPWGVASVALAMEKKI